MVFSIKSAVDQPSELIRIKQLLRTYDCLFRPLAHSVLYIHRLENDKTGDMHNLHVVFANCASL